MLRRSILTCFAVFALGSAAQAAPLNLVLQDSPDIISSFIDVSYDAATDSLSASGFALDINYTDTDQAAIAGGLFQLDAVIDSAGNLLGGALTISGTVAELGYNSGTLLTGTLDQFGAGAGDPLEFIFTVTGGDAAALYGGFGGIILAQTGYSGSFNSDFDNLISGIPGTGTGVADVAAVPIPAAAWLLLSAILSLGAMRRQR
ncbi:MAG: VPLPA-CTERM sorting domain-containing protein [Gammaproteobacteria bacterium]|nr:VPLPA-CTERM sorting domain-containing protein [Gammaproteobacteria bacterium]